jgi:hypothetical protein
MREARFSQTRVEPLTGADSNRAGRTAVASGDAHRPGGINFRLLRRFRDGARKPWK